MNRGNTNPFGEVHPFGNFSKVSKTKVSNAPQLQRNLGGKNEVHPFGNFSNVSKNISNVPQLKSNLVKKTSFKNPNNNSMDMLQFLKSLNNNGQALPLTTSKKHTKKASRKTHVLPTNTPDNKIVTHYWYKSWPDHGVPGDVVIFREFIDKLMDDIRQNPKRGTLIHCSAGIGRTGTLIIILRYCLMHNILNLSKHIKKMKGKKHNSIIIDDETMTNLQTIADMIIEERTYRKTLVQNFDQFLFIYNVLFNKDLILFSKLVKDHFSYLFDKKNSKSRYMNYNEENSFAEKCPLQNRWDILPENDHRVILDDDVATCKGYINASILQDLEIIPNSKREYKKYSKLIAAQCPLNQPNRDLRKSKHTTLDFIKMLNQENIGRIVMLTGLVEEGKNKCESYTVPPLDDKSSVDPLLVWGIINNYKLEPTNLTLI